MTADSLYPEGLAWDPSRSTFLVGSSRHGTVSVVRPDNTVHTLVDDRRVVASYGLTVDAARGRLLVTSADAGTAVRSTPATIRRKSALGIYDLRTGRPLHLVDLSHGDGPHAANDVAVDRAGNAYVTDTLGGTVFRVDTAGRVTGRFRSPLFDATGSGVNGVVVHPAGFLLVGNYETGKIMRVGLDGRRIRPVTLDTPAVGADGLVLRPDGTLLIVTNNAANPAGAAAVRTLRSADGWRSAVTTRLVPWPDPAPTTAAHTPRGTYVVDARLDLTLAGDFSLDEFVLRRW